MIWRSLRGLFGLATLASLAIVGACYWAWTTPLPAPQDRAVRAWSPPDIAMADAAPDGEPNPANEILERPIFNPDRRPFKPQPVVQPEPPPEPEVQESPPEPPPAPEAVEQPVADPPPLLTLKGIMLDGEMRRILVVSDTTPEGAWLKLGDKVGNWTIAKIEKSSATISYGERTNTLQLYVDNSQKTLGTE
jgi:hypothetical protein